METTHLHTKVLFLIAFLFSAVSLYAQNPSIGGQEIQMPTVFSPPPDVYGFQKYGETPVSYYTGIPEISVPLYTIQTKAGVNIPIALSYHSGGIRVDEVSGIAGLGWNVIAEGNLSPKVNGNPDYYSSYQELSPQQLSNLSPTGGTLHPFDSHIYPLYDYLLQVYNGYVDSQRDTYTYSLPGISGEFYLDGNKDAFHIPASNVKVAWRTNGYDLTDGMGNKYEFGFGSSSRKTAMTCGLNSIWDDVNSRSTNYNLKKITTYNKEVVTYNYRTIEYTYITSKNQTKFDVLGMSSSGCTIEEVNCESHSIATQELLTSITYPGGSVTFQYSDQPGLGINGNNTRLDLPAGVALRKVIIKDHNNTEISSFIMNYDYFQSSGGTASEFYRLKLLEVIKDNIEKHTFEYYQHQSLPKRLDFGQDYWGFYNGVTNNTTLIPPVVHNGQTYPGANREVGALENVRAFTLKKIHYPTKGFTEFEFERNNYYQSATGNKLTGGLRISKITSNPSQGLPVVKSYLYNIPGTTNSSGGTNDYPKFHSVITSPGNPDNNGVPNTTSVCTILTRQAASFFALNSTRGQSVGYYNVREVVSGAGYTQFEFTSSGDIYPFTDIVLTPVTSYAWRRGQLLKKSVFDEAGVKQVETENQYTYDNRFVERASTFKIADMLTHNIVVGFKSLEAIQGIPDPQGQYPIYYLPVLNYNVYPITSSWIKNISSTTTTFLPGGNIQEVVTREYTNEANLLPTYVLEHSSDGTSRHTYISYPNDISDIGSLGYENLAPNDTTAINGLKTKHRIEEPIQQRVIVKDANSNPLSIMASRTLHQDFSGIILPREIKTSKGAGPLISRIKFHKYDSYGNLNQVSLADGPPTSYIWGYNKLYPVAKVENATYTQIENLTHFGSNFSLSSELSADQRVSLFAHPGSFVTIYTYKPLIGISGIIDQRQYLTRYEYDGFNRLEYIKDADLNILSEYKYNYKGSSN